MIFKPAQRKIYNGKRSPVSNFPTEHWNPTTTIGQCLKEADIYDNVLLIGRRKDNKLFSSWSAMDQKDLVQLHYYLGQMINQTYPLED